MTLFNDFPPIPSKQWKQKIQADLKGADYNEALVWQSPEGIDVKPFYHGDDTAAIDVENSPNRWNIVQSIFVDDAAVANRLALDALARGAEALLFTAHKAFDPVVLLRGIDTAEVCCYFDLHFLLPDFAQKLALQVGVGFVVQDIIHDHAQRGNWHESLTSDFEKLGTQPQTLAVDATLYHNAGANNVQQLAYALAHAHEYLHRFAPAGKMLFKMAVGGNYFFEIAKLRALRLLYSTLASEYGSEKACHILALPGRRNKTLYDYNVNMLRTTTECMSAVLGGADAVCNLPYDTLYHKRNEFGERIARNQLLILKHESYFESAAQAAEGSYYIEEITRQLAEKALALFKEIETAGGFLKQLKAGTIQKKIRESAATEQQQFDQEEKVLIGTNKYPNPDDRMKHDLELYPFLKTQARKTLIEPLLEKRLSEAREQGRLEKE